MACRWGRIAHWASTLALVAVAAWLFVDLGFTKVRTALADEQTSLFEEMRRKAEEAEGTDLAALEYVLNYYPSGTKQAAGSHLDRVVERARRGAVREILATFRSRTGRDHGDDPRRWIEELKRERGPGDRGASPGGG